MGLLSLYSMTVTSRMPYSSPVTSKTWTQQACTDPRKVTHCIKRQSDKDTLYRRIFAPEGDQGQIGLTMIALLAVDRTPSDTLGQGQQVVRRVSDL